MSDLASSLSTIADTHISSLSSGSQSLSTIGDNIVSLSTSFEQTNGRVTALQQNALQWNGQVYDATRGGRTQTLTGITAGRVEADSTDAINGSQLDSLSTVTESGLSTAASGLSSLSVSTATGLNSLSFSINSSLSNANEGVTELKQDALQWNGKEYDAGRNGNIQKITNVAAGTVGENSTDAVNAGQLFSLSNSTSTGLSDLASSLSTIADTHISSLSSGSQSLSTIGDNIVSLSTSFEQTNGRVTALQQNALQWNGQVYDATRGGRTQTLTGITAGRVEADSTDAINGSQLHSLSTVTESGLSTATSGLNSLSLSTATGLNSLSSSLSSSLSNANQSLTELEQNALQWNGKAYDAGRNGNIQKITNVAAGTVGENSTDAVNAGQLFKLSNSTSTGLSSLSTAVSDIGSISVSMSTGYNELLNSLSTTQDQLGQLETSTNNKLTSLDTDYQTIHNDVDKLRKENRLQWNNDLGNNGEGGFDASRPNSLTRAPSYGKIVNLADGSLEPDSHEAVNGGQLRIVKDDLLSLSSSASTGLSSISSMVQDTPIAQINNDIGNLQENTLQWNGTAYDATHNGTAQRITNVVAGLVGENSTEAVNNHQLWEVRNDLNSLSTTVNNLPTGGNISQDALNNLSASISTSVANQLRPVAEAIGTELPPSGIIPAPDYKIYTSNGETTVHNVRAALENIQNNGASMYAKINSSKQASQAKGEDSIAIGGNAVAQGTSAIAIGDSASAPESNSVALGKEAKVTQDGGVALGAGSVANRAGGRGVGEVYIPPEAKGNDRLVSAIEATRSKEYGAVSVGNTEDGQYRQITGVAAGTEDTDAVNVAQLKGVSNQISKVNEYVNQLNDNLHHVERRAYSGTAMAMALSGAYLPSLSSGGQAVGIGVGTYRSYGAIGVNYKAASKNGKITWGAGVSTTGKEAAVNSAIGFKW
ncbi:hypothetical protein BHC59_00875 [Snodgrassella alvi]|nr:hypothetical protein BHC59_00875 [Snodgrassella alvi]